MKLVYNNNFCELYNGNMLDMISSGHIKPMSIDCIVTDPPYELNFMGKSWDNQGVSFQKETWKVCYDVLKPGGYLLAFGGSRTYHRIACAIEDAGFEIRDTIMWIYGSGFPKSMNLGVAIDKKNGVESELGGIKSGHGEFVGRKTNGHMKFEAGMVGFDRPWMHDEKKREEYHYEKLPTTDEAKEWKGWGTCLKPAFEPVIVARKPFDGSLVENVLKYGVGGLNIDECRIPFESTQNPATNPKYRFESGYKTTANNNVGNGVVKFGTSKNEVNLDGRFPANLILTYDESDYDEVCGGFPYTKSTGGSGEASKVNTFANTYNGGWGKEKDCAHLGGLGDDGSASRYFYCAKASKKDREEGLFSEDGKRLNIHPAVKPTELLEYLVRLVAPKGATILDPFMGSGSTGKAVMFENRERNADYKFIGIELSEEYLPIAEARIKFAEGFELDTKEIEKSQKHPRKSVEKSQKSDEKMFEKWGFDV
jgi:site-specific DNA-methyltransferase (adenine-specific)